MKKNLLITTTLLLLLNLICTGAICQTSEGEITYSASISADIMPDMGSKSFPFITMKFKDDMEVVTMNPIPGLSAAMPMPMEKCIYDFNTKQVNMLVNKDSKKYDVITTQESVEKAMKNKADNTAPEGMAAMLNPDSLKINFTPTDSVVNITGYTCHKYVGSNSLMKMELYASDAADLPQKMASSFSNMLNNTGMGGTYTGVKGFMVKTVIHMNAMGMEMQLVFAVSKVAFKKVSDSEFEIPKDYKKVSLKEYQEILAGNYIEK